MKKKMIRQWALNSSYKFVYQCQEVLHGVFFRPRIQGFSPPVKFVGESCQPKAHNGCHCNPVVRTGPQKVKESHPPPKKAPSKVGIDIVVPLRVMLQLVNLRNISPIFQVCHLQSISIILILVPVCLFQYEGNFGQRKISQYHHHSSQLSSGRIGIHLLNAPQQILHL